MSRESPRRSAGFSLVEIALATAVFGGGALAVIALLGALVVRAGEGRELDEVRVRSDAVRVALRTQVVREGRAAFAASLPPWSDPPGAGRVLAIAAPGSLRVEMWRLPAPRGDPAAFLFVRVRVSGANAAAYGFTVCLGAA